MAMNHFGMLTIRLIFVGLGLCSLFLAGTASEENACNTRMLHTDEGLMRHFLSIVQTPITFEDNVEETACKTLFEQLTKEEKHTAAKTSYAFWYLDRLGNNTPLSEAKGQSALREVRRHLVASNGNLQKALERLKDTLKYRKDHNLDALRTCLEDDGASISSPHEARMREWIVSDMKKQPVVMIGHDKESRAILRKPSRESGGGSEEEYTTTQLYIAERASAISEFISKGSHEKMVAVFDFSRYQSAYSPPLKWQLSAIRTVQNLYPERLHKLIILEPPFWMRGLYQGIRSFLPKATREKIQIVSNRNNLSELLNADDENALFATGNTVDVDRYLKEVPFYCPYIRL